jgi:hypothetical protein
LTKASYSEADQSTRKPLPFRGALAHVLYKSLLGRAEDLIKGKRLLVVASGALTQLPFPGASHQAACIAGSRNRIGLIRDHALTVLPPVASLIALRRTGKPSTAAKPMIGVGNPLLDGNQQDPTYGAY